MNSPISPTRLNTLAELLGRVAEELAFVSPGQDAGLLPLNGLVADLEDTTTEVDLPPVFVTGIAVARNWLDTILDGTGLFSETDVGRLNSWQMWMANVLDAIERATALPDWPQEWTENAADKSSPTPPKAAPPAPDLQIERTALVSKPEDDEPSLLINFDDDAELLAEFNSESVELLQQIEEGVLILEERPDDVATINAIFRSFHTFKGGAGFLHLLSLRDLAHELESLLDAVRSDKLTINAAIIDLILDGGDALKQFTEEIGAQLQGINRGQPISVPIKGIIRRAGAILRGEIPVVLPSTLGPVLTPGAEAVGQAKTSSELSEEASATSESKVRPTASTPTPEPTKSATPSRAKTPAKTTESGFVKVETGKLDALVDLVGELVIAQSMVVQNPDVQKIVSAHLTRCIRQLGRITTELQSNAMSLRTVPIRAAFQKMSRLVRDVSAQQGKQVQIIFIGEDTELDRNIVEKLADPLAHMIRNAVDHGMEGPQERVEKGKSPQGTITLSASHQRGGVMIVIEDDGRGLDHRKLRAKAIANGLIRADSHLTPSAIYPLIFKPGFSTAEKVTDLSGRGVGMDVVLRNVESLRGRIEIDSTLGTGTRFTVMLPLTLAIIEGMLVEVGGERYVIPMLAIRESFRPSRGAVTTQHERGEVVSVRGRHTPLLRLGEYLGTAPRAKDPEDGVIVVVESGQHARGLLVDELIGKQEVVIKGLGVAFEKQNLLAGAAVLSDGWVGLILDVDVLVNLPPSAVGPAPPRRAATINLEMS